jgi:hypothetical protein
MPPYRYAVFRETLSTTCLLQITSFTLMQEPPKEEDSGDDIDILKSIDNLW